MARVAFLFPGQGAQTVGMGRDLCAALPAARRLFEEASALLGYDLLDVCSNGPKERLDSTVVSQPAIFVASLAALEALRADEAEKGAEAECVAAAGLSLGEYTALTFAGVFTFAQGLCLVQRRGEAMQAAADASAGTMVSVLGLDLAKLEAVVATAGPVSAVRVANYLCPGNYAVSGERSACQTVEHLAMAAGAMKTIPLAVAGAFHTALMQPAVAKLQSALAEVTPGEPRIPVWANVTARPYANGSEVRALLPRQVVEPVLWEQTLRGLMEAGCERFYEIGPGRVLAGTLKRIQRRADCRNISA